ncbi:hypothetical protein AMELA_G00204120 [Ameiurus melas]|uniref:C-type lectin domain-containing protein n=1 Tax=Ameiurus melas TaxID=219545 RepID=A0A7J6A545_AMEME|nr:hypothetical protein AMELA_G00204120 [Ameiurus melas]
MCSSEVNFAAAGFFSLGVCLPRQYHFINEKKTWAEAQRYCRENYDDLASINNTEEELALTNTIDIWNKNRTWIGLYDDLNSWKWSLDDDSFFKEGERSFRNWNIQKPKNWNGNSLCVYLSGYSSAWYEASCSWTRPFLCFDATLSSSSRQYHFINENKTWTEAQRYCRENYTDLATVDNMEEMNTLLNTVNGSFSGLAWIGFYDDLDSWRWSLDDDAFYQEGERDFRGWDQQPDNCNGQELCVSINNIGEWFDQPCTFRLSFVCYNDINKTYVWIYNTTTWEEAQSFCRANHTDLASVRNETELQQILNKISYGYIEVWIGLYRNRLWSDQSNSTFTYWRPAIPTPPPEPDNGVNSPGQYRNQHCTAVDHSGGWTDENCFTGFPFICYTGVVTGLQMKVKAEESLLYSEIERIVLMELEQESVRLGLSSNFSVNAIKIRKISP